MLIHNFYVDLMISIRSVFDNYLFPYGNYIKKYEFSIGNRPFQIGKEYNPNYELPAVIITLGQDVHPYSVRPGTIRFASDPDNVHKIPVLYNRKTNSVCYVQEEITVVPLDIIINCESQLQAKEIEYQVRKFFPQDKYIQFFSFVSFFEIDHETLEKMGFNPKFDNIDNLYMKYNKMIDSLEYCFAVNYRPLVKLDSISYPSVDSSQRSFSVAASMSYLIQSPEYLICSVDNYIEKINVHYARYGNEPISIYPLQRIRKFNDPPEEEFTILRNIILYNESDLNVGYGDDKVLLTLKFPDDTTFINDKTIFSFLTTKCEKFIGKFEIIINQKTVTFIFNKPDWEKDLKMTISTPVILQIWNSEN